MLQELKNLGFEQEQIDEVMKIGEQEMVDIVFEDFSFNAPEEKVQEYSKKIFQAKDNPQEFGKLFEEIMAIHYGSENVQKKKEDLLVEYIQNVIDLTKETKDVKQKYDQGDPETVKNVEEAKNSPIVQDMAKKIDELDEEPQDNG